MNLSDFDVNIIQLIGLHLDTPKEYLWLAMTCKKFSQIIRKLRRNFLNKFTMINDNGNYTSYELNGKLHRENDKPALEWENGDKEWWVNGKCHRENDKPAIEWVYGGKEWYVNGKLHRENDKPAFEGANGNKSWYVNGKLHRENDKPALEYANGDKSWYVNGNCIK